MNQTASAPTCSAEGVHQCLPLTSLRPRVHHREAEAGKRVGATREGEVGIDNFSKSDEHGQVRARAHSAGKCR